MTKQRNWAVVMGVWLASGACSISCAGVSRETEAAHGGGAGTPSDGRGGAGGEAGWVWVAGSPPIAAGAPGWCDTFKPCSVEGAQCTKEGGCCSSIYTCRGGQWQDAVAGTCKELKCPADVPAEGSPCDACLLECSYDTCSARGTGTAVDAVCRVGSGWSLGQATCVLCCQDDTECPDGMCVENRCEPLAHAAGCFRDDECEPGQVCAGAQICQCGDPAACGWRPDRLGTCVPDSLGCCVTNHDCNGTDSCVAGVCKPSLPKHNGPGGPCWTDWDCDRACDTMVSVCPCGTSCAAPDHPGNCAYVF